MDTLQPQPDIWEQNPKLKSLLLILIFVFLGSGIGLVVFAQWSNNYREQIYEQTKAGLPLHQIKQATTTPESQTNASAAMAGWKTYKSDHYGFEFEYPSNWNFEDGPAGPTFVPENSQSGIWVDVSCIDAHGVENPDTKVRYTKQTLKYGLNTVIEYRVYYKNLNNPEVLASRTDEIGYPQKYLSSLPSDCQSVNFKVQNSGINQTILDHMFTIFKFTK